MPETKLNGDSTIQELLDHLSRHSSEIVGERNMYSRAFSAIATRYGPKARICFCSELMEQDARPLKSMRGMGDKTVALIADIIGMAPVTTTLTMDSTIAQLANALWQVDKANPKKAAYHRIGSALKGHLSAGHTLEFMDQRYDTVGDIIRGGANAGIALNKVEGFGEVGKIDLPKFFIEQGLQPARQIGG